MMNKQNSYTREELASESRRLFRTESKRLGRKNVAGLAPWEIRFAQSGIVQLVLPVKVRFAGDAEKWLDTELTMAL